MNDTIVIYREPAVQYPDAYKPEYWVAVVLHRKPVDNVARTAYCGRADRNAAISALACDDGKKHEFVEGCCVNCGLDTR